MTLIEAKTLLVRCGDLLDQTRLLTSEVHRLRAEIIGICDQHSSLSRQAKLQMIKEAVATEFGITPESMVMACREAPYTTSRHVAWYAAHVLLGLSSAPGARWLRRQDHGSMLHGIRVVRNRMETDAKFRDRVHRLIDELRPRLEALQ